MILIIISLVLFLDQFTKQLASRNISLNQSLPVIENIFHFTLVHNKGAAFGIFRDQTALFIAVTVVAVTVIFFKLKKRSKRRLDLTSFSLALILGGALGNLIDRALLGYVIDFLDFRVWPVFNVADSAITVGAILLGFSILSKNKN